MRLRRSRSRTDGEGAAAAVAVVAGSTTSSSRFAGVAAFAAGLGAGDDDERGARAAMRGLLAWATVPATIIARNGDTPPASFDMMESMTTAPETTEPLWVTAWSLEEGERRARARLHEACGVEAKSVWSAPGRINIMGEYTDISNGVCLSTLVPHRTFVAATMRTDSRVRIAGEPGTDTAGLPTVWEGHLDSLEDLRNTDAWMSYPAGVLWSLQERGYSGAGMDLAVVSCVPLSSGLSSSTSLAAATALAANSLWGLLLPTDIGATELAGVCMDAENDLVGSTTGGVAQHTILRCAPDEAIYLDFDSPPPAATPCDLTFSEYGLGILIVDTRARSASPVDIVTQRMSEIRDAARALGVASLRQIQSDPDGLARIEALDDLTLRKRARHVFTDNERVDLVRDELSGSSPAHERFVSVGKAMYRSHASLEMDFEISCDELNLAVDTAFRVGAFGARMLGAAGGGSAIALMRRSHAEPAARAIDAAFQDHRLERPRFTFF